MSSDFVPPYCENCSHRLDSAMAELSEGDVKKVSAAKECNIYQKGDVLFAEGDAPAGIFCIHSGKVKVYKTGEEGRQQIVRFAKPGDVVGYRSLVSGEHYTASAAALEDSAVCRIPHETFVSIMKRDASLSNNILQLLTGDLRRAEEKIVNLAQKPVRERVAETLLTLREVYGTENGSESAINVTLSREELASVVGTVTETLVRTLADFKREALIATEKKKIRILDGPGLTAVANLQE